MKTKNFFFIDSRVKNYQAFVSSLGPTDAWVLLNADQDGLDQMVSALAGLQDLDSIQVISHGDQASLTLGSTILNLETVQTYQFQLGAIGASLAAHGDILLYGCNLAKEAEGEQLVQTIAHLTQADVAASNDLTGAAAAGGNWTLEYVVGQLETSVFVPANYNNTLALPTLHEGNPLSGAISGGAGDDEYRGGWSGSTPFGIDSLQVVDLLGNSTVKARMVDPSGPYYSAAVRNSTLVFGDGTVLLDVDSKGGYMPVGIQGSQLTFGDGNSRTTVVIEGPAIYSATGISGSTLKLGGGVDEVDVQVTWNTNSWPLIGISGSTLDLGSGDDRLLVTLINDQVSLSSWAMSGVTVEMGAGNDVLLVRGINGISGGQVSGGDGNDTVEVTTQQSGLKYATLSMGAGNDRVTLTQTGASALSVQNATIDLGAGDDTVQLSRGTATILGGAGTDQLVLPGVRSYYNLVFLVSEVQLTTKDDVFTSLTLIDIESIKFADMTVDTMTPTIAVSSSKIGLIAGDSATLSFTLNVPSTNFIASDVTVTGGMLSNFTGSGTSYTALFTPTSNSTTNGTISIASGVFTDAAGNTNADGSDANNSITLEIDTVIPTIAVSSNKSSLQGGDSVTLTFTLSEAATNFVASDITVSGGTLSNFTGRGTSYSATFTLISNSAVTGTVNIPNGVFTDAAGNKNADGSDANNSVNFSRIPTITNEIHTLSVIVDKNILGASATLLKELKEVITLTNGAITKHIVEYSGLTFDYSQIDSLITTVTRDGDFTAEFTKEINDYLGTELNITYSAAIKLVGTASIDGVVLAVAGADGNYVG